MVTIPTTTHCPPSAYLNSLQRVRRQKWNIDCQNIWDLRGTEGENQKHAYWKCCSSLDLKYWYTTVEHSWGLAEVYQEPSMVSNDLIKSYKENKRLFHYWFIRRLFSRVIRKMKNIITVFQSPKAMSSIVLICLINGSESKLIQFIVIEDNENQKILTFGKLEPLNFCNFCLSG